MCLKIQSLANAKEPKRKRTAQAEKCQSSKQRKRQPRKAKQPGELSQTGTRKMKSRKTSSLSLPSSEKDCLTIPVMAYSQPLNQSATLPTAPLTISTIDCSLINTTNVLLDPFDTGIDTFNNIISLSIPNTPASVNEHILKYLFSRTLKNQLASFIKPLTPQNIIEVTTSVLQSLDLLENPTS
ncbi:MAG: hypothetical protein FD143_3611 [Ignavibacteria bacterium]|nr:MAG: hypothetical protein FD143_3611 [Ignavibacteria bacterium]